MRLKWIIRLLFLAICVVVIFINFSHEPDQSFSRDKWLNSAEKERYVFIDDLTKNILKVGMTKQETIELLGTPSYTSKDESYITYIVGKPTGLLNFSAIVILDIRFNNGKLERTLVRSD
jgi:outer membrane protein assembly factor BamE (lipoprotein component of BamABCDE complex)